MVRHHRHGIETIGPQRILIKHGGVFFDAAGEGDRLGRGQAAVDFDTKIDCWPHRFPQAADVVDCLLDLRGVRFIVGCIYVFVEQRVQMPERGEAGIFQADGFFDEFLDRAPLHVSVQTRFMAHFAAEKFVDGNAEVFSLNVPQRDVDGRHRPGDRASGEMVGTQHDIPMMLDGERISANQIFPVFGNRGRRGLELSPGAGLAQADDPGVGVDPHIQEPVQQQRFDLGDFHGVPPG